MRVGPTLLNAVKNDTELEHLWLGPTFSYAVTISSIVAALPPTLKSLGLDLSSIANRRISACSATGRLVRLLFGRNKYKNYFEVYPKTM